MSFSNSSVLVITNTGATHSFLTGQSSPISTAIPATATGTWGWVVSREGYTSQVGTFDTTGGGFDTASPAPSVRVQANGATLFTASTSALVTIVFDLTDGAEVCYIDIGDGAATAQEVIDAIETALITEDGCKFLAVTNASESSMSVLGGQTFLLLGTQYRLRRAATGDINATVNAFAVSSDGTPVDGANGSINFLQSAEVGGYPFID